MSRQTAGSRTTQPKRPKPSGPASLDLDAIDREDRPEPYTVTIGGRTYEMVDPQELDFRVLIQAQQQAFDGDPMPLFELIVSDEDRDEFFDNDWPSWKLEKMFTLYNEHFGLPTPGEAVASSPYSRRTGLQ